MSLRCLVCGLAFSLAYGVVVFAMPAAPSAAELALALRQISLDSAHTYRVRDIEFARGDIKVYLNEGVLSFFTPVYGRAVAALFTTETAEAGDAEIILMPPQRSERASLASFAKSPNLDEHFSSALFFFTDNTAREITEQIARNPGREPPAVGSMSGRAAALAREIAAQIDVPLVEALLDHHAPEDGLFYGVIGGRNLGAFDVTYDPAVEESITVGRVTDTADRRFQIWTNFRPRRAGPFVPPDSRVHQYRLETTIHDDLSVDVSAQFDMRTDAADGRVLPLNLSPRLKITDASIDGVPVEIFQRPPQRLQEFGTADTLLLIAPEPFAPGVKHNVELRYAGSIVRQTPNGEYFVDDRSTWYPVYGPVAANFDLTFHCPERLRLIATGEPLSESVENGVRTIRRQTIVSAALAGFNLGNYTVRRQAHKQYAIEIDSPATPSAAVTADPTLTEQTAGILDFYTKMWEPLPIRSVAVSPIAGYFGQGFPGLIYLSSVSYIKENERSSSLRSSRMDAFFSEVLLPHEIAHQWWGNIVRNSDYRAAWITEAMANLSALEYVAHTRGDGACNELFENYRHDLLKEKDGKTLESAGPVDFGERLIDAYGMGTWQTILYEKGSWILNMLRQRLGADRFRQMQLKLLADYAKRPLNNEDFKQAAAAFVPPDQPDRKLENFFSTWVYGTGIPGLALHHNLRNVSLEVTGVDDDYLVEVPLRCNERSTFWVRAGAGSNTFELPRGVSSCELPSMRDFLYTAPR